MKTITLTRKTNTVSAPYLPYTAYKAALALADAHKGEIGSTAEGFFKVTFANAKIAKKFVDEWTAEYEDNRKVEVAPAPAKPKTAKGKADLVTVTVDGVEYTVPASALVPTKAPKASSTKKTTAKATAPKKSTTSPKKAKGKAFDYSVIKGKTTQAKNKALHKELVKMGLKDSRTPEYMSIWNARPWAN